MYELSNNLFYIYEDVYTKTEEAVQSEGGMFYCILLCTYMTLCFCVMLNKLSARIEE